VKKRHFVVIVLAFTNSACSQNMPVAKTRLRAKLDVVARDYPKGWNFVLLAENDWQARSESHSTPTAFSSFCDHVTVIRASYAERASDLDLLRTLEHEAGHIQCQCYSESIASRFAEKKVNLFEKQLLHSTVARAGDSSLAGSALSGPAAPRRPP